MDNLPEDPTILKSIIGGDFVWYKPGEIPFCHLQAHRRDFVRNCLFRRMNIDVQ